MDYKAEIQKTKKEIDKLKMSLKNAREKSNDANLIDYKAEVPNVTKNDTMFQVRRTLKGHSSKIYAIQWADDSKNIVSASQDGKLIVWNARENIRLNVFIFTLFIIFFFHFFFCFPNLFFLSFSTYPFLLKVIPLKSTWVMTCAYGPTNSQLIACGGLDNICTIYNLRSKDVPIHPTRELSAHTGYVSCCRFFNDNSIITSSGDMTCIYWDIEKGSKIAEFNEHNGDVMCISISPDKKTFVTGSCDATVKIWDIRTAKCIQTFQGHDSDVNAVTYMNTGYCIASGSDDATCKLYDIRADRELQQYEDDSLTSNVTSVSFSNSGRLLFTSYEYLNCIVWDTISGQILSTLPHNNRVSTVSVNADGNAIATSSWDTLIRVWA